MSSMHQLHPSLEVFFLKFVNREFYLAPETKWVGSWERIWLSLLEKREKRSMFRGEVVVLGIVMVICQVLLEWSPCVANWCKLEMFTGVNLTNWSVKQTRVAFHYADFFGMIKKWRIAIGPIWLRGLSKNPLNPTQTTSSVVGSQRDFRM